jgi:hypothetical protein
VKGIYLPNRIAVSSERCATVRGKPVPGAHSAAAIVRICPYSIFGTAPLSCSANNSNNASPRSYKRGWWNSTGNAPAWAERLRRRFAAAGQTKQGCEGQVQKVENASRRSAQAGRVGFHTLRAECEKSWIARHHHRRRWTTRLPGRSKDRRPKPRDPCPRDLYDSGTPSPSS